MRYYKSTIKWYRAVDIKPPIDLEETPGPRGEIYSKFVYVTDGGKDFYIDTGRYVYNWNEAGLIKRYKKEYNWKPPQWEPNDGICQSMSTPGYWSDDMDTPPPFIEDCDPNKEDEQLYTIDQLRGAFGAGYYKGAETK